MAAVNKDAVDHQEVKEVKAPVDETDYSEKSTQKAKFSDYMRIFTYTTLSDRILLGLAFIGQIGYVVTFYLSSAVWVLQVQ